VSGASRRPITGRQVFWALFAFFAAVAAMNVVMIYLGSSSWTGLTTKSSYERGVHYNETLQQVERQSALGWRSDFEFQSGGGNSGRLTVTLTDRSGHGIDKLEVEGTAIRPTSEGADQTLAFSAQGGGRYTSEVTLPLPGQWDILVRAAGQSEIYRTRHRINVK
jgi:nitrogen fixation protein FixH